MIQFVVFLIAAILAGSAPTAWAQGKDFEPVTQEMLLNPDPADWLMLSRTYDEQRFSPLDQINRQNVGRLRMVWARGMAEGVQESVPLVYRGVMYVISPGASVQALDATTGDLVWEYRRKYPDDMQAAVLQASRAKGLAIFEDMIYYTAPDGYIVAIGARSGKQRWETQAQERDSGAQHTSAPIVADGKVITGRVCADSREECFIAAHDARTGELRWKFYTTAAPGEPGGDSWGNVPVNERIAGTWGLPGSYDPARKLVYWGVANPKPYTRLQRHGSADGVSPSAPANAYSNSTVAINVETGKLAWYYQHLPGDDWDSDHAHERVLLRTAVNPDPAAVKWINPKIRRGEQRDIAVSVGEPGGVWALDRGTGEFLWAMPFPYDVPDFHISRIDVETGTTYINWDKVFKKDGDRSLICFFNTRSYWPTAYSPQTNSLYVPYIDSCLNMTADTSNPSGYRDRRGGLRPGVDPGKAAGIGKINMETGRIERFYEGPVPGNGAMLTTAGGLVFWGDINRRLRAFDAESGKILWENILGGVISVSTIAYAVDGKQYIAVMTGDGQSGTRGLFGQVAGLTTPRGHNAIYVFALP